MLYNNIELADSKVADLKSDNLEFADTELTNLKTDNLKINDYTVEQEIKEIKQEVSEVKEEIDKNIRFMPRIYLYYLI